MEYRELSDQIINRIPVSSDRKDAFFYKYNYFVRKPKVPYEVQIEPTNACNFNCIMCYDRNMETGFMPLDVYKGIVDELVDAGTRSVMLQWRGESFLHPDILEMIEYGKQKNLRLHITSNGSSLTPCMSEKIVDLGLDEIRFSFNAGTPGTFKRICGVDYFFKCLRNIQSFIRIRNRYGRKKPTRVYVKSVVMRDNKGDLHLVKDLFKVKPDAFGYSSCSYHPLTMCYDGRVVKNSFKRTVPCNSLFNTLSVTWDGRVTTCCVDSNCSLVLGDVGEGVVSVFNSDKMKQYRRWHLNGDFDRMQVCRFCMSKGG